MQKYPVSIIAQLLNLSERRVQQLAKDGIIPKADKGKYDLVSSVRSYVKYLYERAFGQNNESIDSHVEKARLLKAQAAKAEFDLAVSRGEYAKCDELEFEYGGLVLAFRSRMLSLPSKIVPKLAVNGNNFAKMEQILEDEIHDALLELSKPGNSNNDDG
jgi:phage terminase Nu1 subunit (DNA packaging protein)